MLAVCSCELPRVCNYSAELSAGREPCSESLKTCRFCHSSRGGIISPLRERSPAPVPPAFSCEMITAGASAAEMCAGLGSQCAPCRQGRACRRISAMFARLALTEEPAAVPVQGVPSGAGRGAGAPVCMPCCTSPVALLKNLLGVLSKMVGILIFTNSGRGFREKFVQ